MLSPTDLQSRMDSVLEATVFCPDGAPLMQTLVYEQPHVGDEDGEPPFPGEEVPVGDNRHQPLHDVLLLRHLDKPVGLLQGY